LRVVAFIPSRSGSKGVPRKNVRPLNGKSLIARTIEEALRAKEISEIIVTTNCVETKLIASQYPVLLVDRPDYLAEDNTSTYLAIMHALSIIKIQKRILPDVVLVLQCTSPLRKATHITGAIKLFENSNVKSVISVMEVGDEHPARMYRLGQEQRLEALVPSEEKMRRQDLPKLYRRNGAIYALRYSELERQQTLIARDATAFIMPIEASINIDTELDFLIAEALLEREESF